MARNMIHTLATMSSTIESFMYVWSIVRNHLPYELRDFFQNFILTLMSFLNPYIQISFHELLGERLRTSRAYLAVEAYLNSKKSKTSKRLNAELGKDSSNLVLTMDEYDRLTDEFRGVKVWWVLCKVVLSKRSSYPVQEKKYYKLIFHKRYRETITGSYLEHVMREGKEIRARHRQRRLYTNSAGNHLSPYYQCMWSDIVFEHPATFETMAMDLEKKQEIIEDLFTFSKSQDFYARIGKAWKRGYLLYGPPGTGKSTLIAAMANLLCYDVYDLELTAVKDNTELRKLLIETSRKSIIVIEDIDCSLDLTGKRKKADKSSDNETKNKHKEVSGKGLKEEKSTRSNLTLSGLLNFIDGLWSACGGERLIVLTTNHVEKLDPALIRSGRMDKHIELSYCNFNGFKVLAKNYLNLESHRMFDRIQQLLEETKITPADVAENLMPKTFSDEADKCLSSLIEAMERAKEADVAKKLKESISIERDTSQNGDDKETSKT
ncbi:AAA-ATPase [Quillaja saponaria]|uniref:AAA-ATPase n=1 Tax=Quillaja saponaria TaxID=32244 RepID=A0AAD7QEV7_QUISA|nr:AAA-ATPase [Quillaja saponaria]